MTITQGMYVNDTVVSCDVPSMACSILSALLRGAAHHQHRRLTYGRQPLVCNYCYTGAATSFISLLTTH